MVTEALFTSFLYQDRSEILVEVFYRGSCTLFQRNGKL